MIKEAIDRILELGKPATTDVEGLTYWTASGNPILPPLAKPLTFRTLDGFVRYIQTAPDGLPDGSYITVESPTEVSIVAPIDDPWNRRQTYARAEVEAHLLHDASRWEPGRWYDLEEFIIKLQAQFVPNPDQAEILRILGSVSEEDTRTHADDGVTQEVTLRRALDLKDRAAIPNPAILAPFRTFPDLGQPESPFILRLRGGTSKEAALYEADGGLWRNKIIHNDGGIAWYLRGELPEIPILA